MYNEILSLGLPLNRPAVLDEIKRRPAVADAVAPPPTPPLKQAPMMESELILAIEQAATNPSLPRGLRLFASTCLIMVIASLRFADTKIVYTLWQSGTAVCG